MKNLPDQIRAAREGRNLTQRDLAKQARVSVDIVGKIERAQASPSTRVLQRLAEALDAELAIELRPKRVA